MIEVMGLAILPGRLKEELDLTADILAGDEALFKAVKEQEDHPLRLHKPWIEQLAAKYGIGRSKEEAWKLVQSEVGDIFVEILGHAGVYKRTEAGKEAFFRFVSHLGCTAVQ